MKKGAYSIEQNNHIRVHGQKEKQFLPADLLYVHGRQEHWHTYSIGCFVFPISLLDSLPKGDRQIKITKGTRSESMCLWSSFVHAR